MEAADDIAYATGDIEDVLKKGFVDYATIRGCLEGMNNESRECVEMYLDKSYEQFNDLAASERQQLAVQRFCQMAIRKIVQSAIRAFLANFRPIMDGTFDEDLVGVMPMSDLCQALKSIMVKHVYSHVEIAYREQTARSVIGGLLGAIIEELQDRQDEPLATSTYREARLHTGEVYKVSDNYRLAQRATDYVAGMTDGYALAQYQRISGMRAAF